MGLVKFKIKNDKEYCYIYAGIRKLKLIAVINMTGLNEKEINKKIKLAKNVYDENS